MKLFLILIITTAICKDLESFLKTSNRELEKINQKMHDKLTELSEKFHVQVKEDFSYNKQRVLSLVFEYNQEADFLIKVFLAEEICQFIRGLIQDAYLLGGSVEGVNSADMLKLLQTLIRNIKSSKENLLKKENENFYKQLKSLLTQKQEVLQDLQVENSKIFAKTQSLEAELRETQRKVEKCIENKTQIQAELDNLRLSHSARSLELQRSYSASQVDKELENNLPDETIAKLDLQSNEKLLEIERLNTEVSILNSTFRVLNEKITQLKTELAQKSEVLIQNQEKFSEFAKNLRGITVEQAASVRSAEEELEAERKEISAKNKDLRNELAECSLEVTTLKTFLRTKNIIIEENRNELNQTLHRKRLAYEQIDKEIQSFTSQNLETEGRIGKYKRELDENLQKIEEKAKEGQELQGKPRFNAKSGFH